MSRLSLAPLVLLGAATGLVLAGCGGGGGGSASPAVTQSVSSFVFDVDSAAPVVGATVKVTGTNATSPTDGNGEYTLKGLNPSRSYDAVVTAPGYVDSVVKLLTTNNTLQGAQVILQKIFTPATVPAAGGTVTSNATLDNNTSTLVVPANALPGGVPSASISLTLITGTAVPGEATDNTQVIYPAVNISGVTGSFTQPVTLTFPLAFPMTASAQIPVLKLGANGVWVPAGPNATVLNATVAADGKSASVTTTSPGTYGLSIPLQATATVNGNPDISTVTAPYTDPVIVTLTGATVNWTGVSGQDGRDALDSAFVQNQRQGDILIPGDLDATQLVIHPRGTSSIEVVKDSLNVIITPSGFTVQQTGSSTVNGTIDGLAHYEIVPHQQGSGGGI